MSRVLHSMNAQHRIGDLLAGHMAAANLLGRTQVAREVYRKTGKRVPLATVSRYRTHHRFAEDDPLPDGTALGGFSVEIPHDLAAGYLRNLTPVTRDIYDGLSAQYKQDAFTVAGTNDVRLIAKVRDALADTLAHGGTKADFEKAVAQLTSDAGVREIAAFTLDTVFTTNMQKAYSLGRYEQQMEPATMDALPYGQYLTVGDDRVRPEHAVLDGFIARMEDRVWRKIYPPNGFNCRCVRIALLKEELPEGYPADEDGMARLPLLAIEKVPTPGFGKVFGA